MPVIESHGRVAIQCVPVCLFAWLPVCISLQAGCNVTSDGIGRVAWSRQPQGPPRNPDPAVGPQSAHEQGTTTVTRTCSLAKAVRAARTSLKDWVSDLKPAPVPPGLVGYAPNLDECLRSLIEKDVLALGAITQRGSRFLERWLRMLATKAAPLPPLPAPRPPGPSDGGGGGSSKSSCGGGAPLPPLPAPGPPGPSDGGGGGSSSCGGGAGGAPGPCPGPPAPMYVEFMPETFDWVTAIYSSLALFREGSQGPQAATVASGKLQGFDEAQVGYVASHACVGSPSCITSVSCDHVKVYQAPQSSRLSLPLHLPS